MWPKNVGISAIEIYFPYYYVDQQKLEKYDGVSSGKYTIGLGQKKMGFCGDNEDINSLCLTVVKALLENNKIDPKDVGRLEVGTETIIDKSKSVKTVLMQLFEESGNSNIEGVDTTNACYGGTSALFNTINWIESSAYDDRLGIVVIADIAVYAEGNARCTGGGGAIAMVISPNAPLVFDRGLRVTHMQHVYDFYKPNMSSEYPIIDGQLSVKCFLSALDKCYQSYATKYLNLFKKSSSFTLNDIDFLVFHTPYCKLVQKSIGRCFLNDFVKNNNNEGYESLKQFNGISLNSTFSDLTLFKSIEKVSVACSKELFMEKSEPSIYLAENIGNMYTPSLYSCLISLLLKKDFNELQNKRVVLFSYGSGLASSMFSLTLCPQDDLHEKFINIINSLSNVMSRIDSRKEVEPEKFVEILKLREQVHNANNYVTVGDIKDLFPGTYYLTHVDEKYRRFYKRKPLST